MHLSPVSISVLSLIDRVSDRYVFVVSLLHSKLQPNPETCKALRFDSNLNWPFGFDSIQKRWVDSM